MVAVPIRRVLRFNEAASLLASFILLIVVASLVSPAFLSIDNLQNIVRTISVIGIISLGMTIVLVAGEVDLSVGSVTGLAGMVGAFFVDLGSSTAVVSATLAAGLLAGLVNGIGVALVGVPSLIMTLGTLAIARALGNIISQGQAAYPSGLDFYMWLGRGEWLGIPVPILLFALFSLLALVIMRFTAIGRKFYAVGSNPRAAQLSGVNATGVKLFAFAFAGLCAGLANIIQSARLDQIDPAIGQGYELVAIAIAVLGGASLFGGRGSIEGTVIAALIIGVLYNLFNLVGLSGHIHQVFVAVIIVFMAWLHGLQGRR